MTESINAILIHLQDNVVTVKEALTPGDTALFYKSGEVNRIEVSEDIPKFHKLALNDIAKGQPVYKYGQLIGEATKAVSRGQHIHVHNIASPKKN